MANFIYNDLKSQFDNWLKRPKNTYCSNGYYHCNASDANMINHLNKELGKIYTYLQSKPVYSAFYRYKGEHGEWRFVLEASEYPIIFKEIGIAYIYGVN